MITGMLTLAHVSGELKGKKYLKDREAQLRCKEYESGIIDIMNKTKAEIAAYINELNETEKALRDQAVKV